MAISRVWLTSMNIAPCLPFILINFHGLPSYVRSPCTDTYKILITFSCFSDKALRYTSTQRSYQRWLDRRIYKTEMKFWAVLGSRGCREKKTSQLPKVCNTESRIQSSLLGLWFHQKMITTMLWQSLVFENAWIFILMPYQCTTYNNHQ